jgi:MFS family permease
VTDTRRQLHALFLTRFANAYGYVTLLTLLSTYVNILDPSGLVLGLFVTGLTLMQVVAVVPVAWAGDRFDKRLILLGGLALAAGWLPTEVGITWVFYLGAGAAFTGVAAFAGILAYSHGREALTAW